MRAVLLNPTAPDELAFLATYAPRADLAASPLGADATGLIFGASIILSKRIRIDAQMITPAGLGLKLTRL